MDEDFLETVEHETGSPVGASVIWMHGLGADGHDFEPIVPALGLRSVHLRFVFPHAPVRPVTLNGGMPMRAWFDIVGIDRNAIQDEAGIRRAESQVHALLRRENERGVPSEKIVLAGFSQGGAVALHTALRYPERLAAVLALSTFLPLRETVDAEAGLPNRETPFFMGHGAMDPLVIPALGEETRDFLRERGYAVDWRSYPMVHAVCPDEVEDIRRFLSRTLEGEPTP